MRKIISLGFVIAAMVSSTAAFAATNNSTGTIQFEGAIINGACDLQSNDDSQNIKMGQASVNTLKGGGKGERKDVVLHLINCDTSTLKTVSASFTGASEPNDKTALVLDGPAKGAGIHMQTAKANSEISWDGTAVPAENLTNGSYDLTYMAQLVGNGGDESTITPGDYTATTHFELSYQ